MTQSNRHYNPAGRDAFDVLTVGGGPVALAFSCAASLASGGLSAAVVAKERAPVPRSDQLDARVYTLSPGNVEFLRTIGAWQAIAPERVTPVHGMCVYGDRPGAEIRFDAYGAGVPEVGWTVEDAVLHEALWKAAGLRPEVSLLAPAECDTLRVQNGKAVLRLRDGRELSASLVVGADGASSFVRDQARIPVRTRDYDQAAVVANFECEKPHGNIAYQWFQRGPVLALLPLPGRQTSMVWSLASAEAQRMLRLDADRLCQEVERASHGQLGALRIVTPPRSYPLRRLSAQRLVAPRVALAGDAAHVIHPLAGQGLNLGLQDARALAEVIVAREAVRDTGDAALLRRYERRRAEPILAMDLMVDGLFRLFGAEGEWLSRARNAGLNLSGRLPVLKNLLMRHAMS